MREILDYLNNNYQKDLTAKEVARKFGLSIFTLSKKFNKQVGQKFDLYIQGLRLGEARKLIGQGTTLKEACYSAGFQSESQFCRVFKARLGMTPKQYKESQILDKKEIQGELDCLLAQYVEKIKSGHVGWGVSFVSWLEINNHYLLFGFNQFKKIEKDVDS